MTFTSYTNGKITLVMNNNSPGNMLYKNNIALPNTSDIQNITIDATSGDTFSYGIYPSILSSIIKIPCSPRVKLNNVVQNDVTNNYNINIVVYYDYIILDGKITFVVSDIDDNIVQIITCTNRMMFVTIVTTSLKLLNIKTRINYGDLYIDSPSVKISK